MLALTAPQRAALESRVVMRRLFIWIDARDPITGDPSPAGFWDDVGDVTVDARVYHGSGSVISTSSLSAKGDLTIPGLQVTLSGIDSAANVLVRGKAVAQAPIEVRIGIFDPATHTLIGPLVDPPLFTGFIDDCDIRTPEAGGKSDIVFICESTSRALTLKRTSTRSESTQHDRDPNDDFYSYTAAQRGKPLYFGMIAPGQVVSGGAGPDAR